MAFLTFHFFSLLSLSKLSLEVIQVNTLKCVQSAELLRFTKMTGTHVTGVGPQMECIRSLHLCGKTPSPAEESRRRHCRGGSAGHSLACLMVLGCILLQAPSLLDDRVSENRRQQQCVEGGEDGTGPNCPSLEVALAELVLGSEAET